MTKSGTVARKQILTITETVARAKADGYSISEYTLRRAIRAGMIPCRIIGKTYLIAWKNVVRWLLCEDGQDNQPVVNEPAFAGIRRIE